MPQRPIHPLKRELFERQRTASDLARAIGYSPAVIAEIAKGGRSWPKVRRAIAAELGRPVHELFPNDGGGEVRR